MDQGRLNAVGDCCLVEGQCFEFLSALTLSVS